MKLSDSSIRFSGLSARLLFGLILLIPGYALEAQPTSSERTALRVCLVSTAEEPESLRAALKKSLESTFGPNVVLTSAERKSDGRLSLACLKAADAAVFLQGPGPLAEGDAAELREFLNANKGTVILAAAKGRWDALPGFIDEYLGAQPDGRFADGAAMSVINLFPHSIYTGITSFETEQAMPLWLNLAEDAQLIMEGTVGEETAPLAWVRRWNGGRLCHIAPGGSQLVADVSYMRIVANAVLWASGRAIPDAQAIVQRTFMPESHPGSIAITFPSGPGVCFDPVRGGINFIWDGDFVDLRPRWLTKQGAPARIFGRVFYRETLWQPMRLEAPTRDADFQFRGYRLTSAGPKFHYQINGRDVVETFAATSDGQGLLRQFRVGAGVGPLWIRLEPQAEAEISLTGLVRDGEHALFASAAAGEFSIEIRRRAGDAL